MRRILIPTNALKKIILSLVLISRKNPWFRQCNWLKLLIGGFVRNRFCCITIMVWHNCLWCIVEIEMISTLSLGPLALDNECYASLTKIQQRSLSCSRSLLLMYENKAPGTEIYDLLPYLMHVCQKYCEVNLCKIIITFTLWNYSPQKMWNCPNCSLSLD